MHTTGLVLLPPIIVLIMAFLLKRLQLALIIGLASAALIGTNFSFKAGGFLLGSRILEHFTDIDNIYTYSFLLFVGMIIVMINLSGGAQAFARRVTQKITSAKNAETTLIPISLSLFLDDYLNSLTVGSIMRPITDLFKIPRAKLAFLVHSLSGAIVILVPISSWVTMILSQLDQAGVQPIVGQETRIIADPFFIYLGIIPFIFYALLTILSVSFIVRRSISFGPMHTHETVAAETNNLFNGKQPIKQIDAQETHGSTLDLFIPLIVLVASVLIGIPYYGGYYLLGGQYSLLESFQRNNQTFFIMFIGSIAALVIGAIYSLIQKTISLQQIPTIIWQGINLMLNAVIIVGLASTLGYMLRVDLHTGNYLALLLFTFISLTLLPCIFFITACITSLILGTAWGTIALLIPIALPMITTLSEVGTPTTPDMLPILFPALGAILSGALFGDHTSPIAGATIVSATSTGSYPLDHSITQFPYALPTVIGSIVAFLLSGFLMEYGILINASISLTVGIITNFGLLTWLNKK